jgi:alkylation response protein AidB-like acyl-CoA dehydrogenase
VRSRSLGGNGYTREYPVERGWRTCCGAATGVGIRLRVSRKLWATRVKKALGLTDTAAATRSLVAKTIYEDR